VLERVLPRFAACRAGDDQATCTAIKTPTVETVFIEGHTDTTGVPDLKDRDRRNWELSTERAVATYREIVQQTPVLRQLRNQQGEEIISVSGYSSTRPIDPREVRDAWEKNRRIDLRFVMETDTKEGLRHILDLTNAMKSEIDHLVAASGPAKPAAAPAAPKPAR
jgi:chemotaxis protein MotB